MFCEIRQRSRGWGAFGKGDLKHLQLAVWLFDPSGGRLLTWNIGNYIGSTERTTCHWRLTSFLSQQPSLSTTLSSSLPIPGHPLAHLPRSLSVRLQIWLHISVYRSVPLLPSFVIELPAEWSHTHYIHKRNFLKVSNILTFLSHSYCSFIHSFSNLSEDRSNASSKMVPPHSAF